AGFMECITHAVVVLLAGEAGGIDEERGDLVEPGAIEDGRGGFVGEDDAEIDIECARGDGVQHTFQRSPACGSENADAETHTGLALLEFVRRAFMWSTRRAMSAAVPMSER